MTNLRTALLATAVPMIASVLLVLAANPAGAHPLERCFFGWTEVDGVPVDGSPENPRHICYDEYHPHPWRNVIIGAATIAALYPLTYALIMTPEALWQEKATRRGRWRLIVRPRQLYRALPRRHRLAFWCSFPPAYLAGYVAAPPLLEWAFPPLSTAAVAVYVAVCALVAVAGSCTWVRKRRKGELAASQQPAASNDALVSLQ